MRYLAAAITGFLILVAQCGTASADLTASVGIGKGVVEKVGFERSLSIGYAWNLSRSLYLKPELGGYLAHGEGRQHSAYASLLFGFRVSTPVGLYAFAGAGPTYLTTPDWVVLSGKLQYNLQAGICLREDAGMALCWKLQHLSNCHGCPGIGGPAPNIGIDLFAFEIALCKF